MCILWWFFRHTVMYTMYGWDSDLFSCLSERISLLKLFEIRFLVVFGDLEGLFCAENEKLPVKAFLIQGKKGLVTTVSVCSMGARWPKHNYREEPMTSIEPFSMRPIPTGTGMGRTIELTGGYKMGHEAYFPIPVHSLRQASCTCQNKYVGVHFPESRVFI